jgi:ribosomal-protein-alanine N-acetyltransferase
MNLEPDVTIRLALPADVVAIRAIDHLCFPALLAYDMDTFLFYLHDRSSETWVADSAEGVIGFAIFQMESRSRAHFITLDVLPEHRKKRVGSALMDHAHGRAMARGASVMILQVAVANQVAMDFYERRGYVKTRMIKKYYEDKTDAWEMKLDLRKP